MEMDNSLFKTPFYLSISLTFTYIPLKGFRTKTYLTNRLYGGHQLAYLGTSAWFNDGYPGRRELINQIN